MMALFFIALSVLVGASMLGGTGRMRGPTPKGTCIHCGSKSHSGMGLDEHQAFMARHWWRSWGA